MGKAGAEAGAWAGAGLCAGYAVRDSTTDCQI